MKEIRGTILIIDDDDANRYVKSRLLKLEGFRINEADTGTHGLELLQRDTPDLIILDVKLPDINGLEVCKRIKDMPGFSAIPVIQTSASFVDATHKARGLDGGADTYLVEPTEPIVLIATVNSLLRLRRSEMERAELLVRETAARKEAERANRSKDEFLATLSHELRTPMSAIVGWSKLLLTGKLDEAKQKHGLAVIHRNARMQAQLIGDLLDVSRIVSGKLLIDQSIFDLSTVVIAAVESVRLSMEAKQFKLMLSISKEEVHVKGDAARLQQAIWNLLSNAVKFTPAAGNISVSLTRKAGLAEVVVSDSGMGIEPEFLPHLFERFTQADSSSIRLHGGLGIGLSLVRSLIELHGGKVRAESPGLGKGATFIMTIPLTTESTDTVQWLMKRNSSKVETLNGVNVLAVDDEPDAREILGLVLRAAGAGVRILSSADEALSEYIREKPHIIVSDIGMPGKDGISLIKEIRKLENGVKQVPAIAVTAFAHDEDYRRSINSGFQAHLAKPVDPETLISMIGSLLPAQSSHNNGS